MAEPTKQQWKTLIELATEFKRQAPWQSLFETQLIGFVEPATGELCFASVMGALGDHFAVAVYFGAEGFARFLQMQQDGPQLDAAFLLETAAIHVSLEDRQDLDKRDYAIVKGSGVRVRGRKSWPQFRRYAAGFAPWYIDGDDAGKLIVALQLVLNLDALLTKAGLPLLPVEDNRSLVFRSQSKAPPYAWQGQIEPIKTPPPGRPPQPRLNPALVGRLKKAQRIANVVEIDCFALLSAGVGKPGERPILPYMTLAVDADSGFIVGFETGDPSQGLAAMWQTWPDSIMQIFANHAVCPERIRLQSPICYQLLEPVAQACNIQLEMAFELPMLNEAKAAMLDYF